MGPHDTELPTRAEAITGCLTWLVLAVLGIAAVLFIVWVMLYLGEK